MTADSTSQLVIKDSTGTQRVVNTTVDVGGNTTPQHAIRINGAPVEQTNPLPVFFPSITPADFSQNAMTVPLAGYVLLLTIPATPNRSNVEIDNLSGAQIQIALDDGQNTAGTISTFLLAGGNGTPSQGGAWADQTFKGRVKVYAPSSAAIVTARQN